MRVADGGHIWMRREQDPTWSAKLAKMKEPIRWILARARARAARMRMMTSWDQRGIGRNEFVRLSGLRVDLRSEQNPLRRRRRRPVHRLRHHPHLVLPLRVHRAVVVPQSERRGRRGSPSPAKRGVERRNGKGRRKGQRPHERNERPLSDKKSSRQVRTMAVRTQAHSASGPRRSLIGSG